MGWAIIGFPAKSLPYEIFTDECSEVLQIFVTSFLSGKMWLTDTTNSFVVKEFLKH
jgi:hypothetical protein